jgi:NADH-quinone oxidoreductase subunit G
VAFHVGPGGSDVAVRITVCVGSSCHIRGSRDVLKRFAEIVKAENLEDEVSLLGSFCMERCGEGMNWKFNDQDISSGTVQEAEETLRGRLVEVSRKA